MADIFAEFAKLRGQEPGSAPVQALVEKWQAYISAHFYACSKETLAGLGQMYTADERFTKNIDQAGEGTAALLSAAIAAYPGESEAELFTLAAQAAEEGAENSKNFVSKFGRAKSYGARTIGTPDAGAVSMACFFHGLAKD